MSSNLVQELTVETIETGPLVGTFAQQQENELKSDDHCVLQLQGATLAQGIRIKGVVTRQFLLQVRDLV